MEGKQNRWDTNCTFIHLKVQGNFPSAPVKFSDCLSILWAFHSSKGFGFVQCPDSYTHTHTHTHTKTYSNTNMWAHTHTHTHQPESSLQPLDTLYVFIITQSFTGRVFKGQHWYHQRHHHLYKYKDYWSYKSSLCSSWQTSARRVHSSSFIMQLAFLSSSSFFFSSHYT